MRSLEETPGIIESRGGASGCRNPSREAVALSSLTPERTENSRGNILRTGGKVVLDRRSRYFTRAISTDVRLVRPWHRMGAAQPSSLSKVVIDERLERVKSSCRSAAVVRLVAAPTEANRDRRYFHLCDPYTNSHISIYKLNYGLKYGQGIVNGKIYSAILRWAGRGAIKVCLAPPST